MNFDITEKKLVDVQNIFHKMEQRTLAAAYQFYCNKELVNAHSAEADTIATYEILLAQLDRYSDLKSDVDFLHTFSKRGNNVDLAGRFVSGEKGKIHINFGKHKGKELAVVLEQEPSYYSWMMRGDFAQDTKKILKKVKFKLDEKKTSQSIILR